MRKADRLFQVVNLIRVHQPIAAASLAERLCVSVRTIYRYIDDLSLGGIPIYGEPGIGYSMHKDFELPPLTLSKDELDALTLSVSMLSRSTGYELSASAKSLLSKIDAVIPVNITSSGDSAIYSLATPYSDAHKKYWDQLRKAISNEGSVCISYLSLRGQKSEREIFPLGLFYWGGKWTLGAWCFLRQEYREFRVDLIQAIRVSSTKRLPCKGINLAAYVQHQVENLNDPKDTDNTLSVGPR